MSRNTQSITKTEKFLEQNRIVMPGDASIVRSSFSEDLKSRVLQSRSHNLGNTFNLMESLTTFFKKNSLLLGGFFLVIATAAVTLSYFPGLIGNFTPGGSDTPNLIGANLSYTDGTVEYKSSGGGWHTAKNEVDLFQGYSVRVLGEGRAVINLDEGSAIRLDSDSSVTLSSLNPEKILIANNKGEIYTRVVKADREFSVKTDEVTYKSLGTAYKTINTDEVEGVEVYHSKVEILGVDSEDKILVEQGEKYYIVNKTAPESEMQVQEVSLDEIKQDEFVVWNKEQDETVAEFKENMGVLFDLEPPVLTVSAPANNAKTEATSVDVKGTTEAGVKLYINGVEFANDNGNFTYKFTLNVGNNGIKVEAVDEAGNKTIVNLNVVREKVVVDEPAPKTGITLYGTKVDSGVSLTWNVSGLDTSKGFKVVKGLDSTPTYGEDSAQFLDGSKRKYTWPVTDGKTYYFRVCTYTGSGCNNYSNAVKVTAPGVKGAETTGSAQWISLASTGGTNFSWSIGGTAPGGFKLVWSTTPNPTYGSNGTGEYKNPGDRNGSISATDPGTYYVRICEYVGGTAKCVNYSNQVTITLP